MKALPSTQDVFFYCTTGIIPIILDCRGNEKYVLLRQETQLFLLNIELKLVQVFVVI